MNEDLKTVKWEEFANNVRVVCDNSPTLLSAHEVAEILRSVADEYDVEG